MRRAVGGMSHTIVGAKKRRREQNDPDGRNSSLPE